MSEHERAHARKFVRWVQQHRHLWTLLHVRGVAIRHDGVWTVVWLRVDLAADESSITRIFSEPLVHRDVLVIDDVLPATGLERLWKAIRRGRLPHGMFQAIPGMDFAWAPRSTPSIQGFDDRIAPAVHYVPLGRWRSQVSITLNPGSLNDWSKGNEARREFLRRIDNTFETLGLGRLAAVGGKLDLIESGTSNFSENSLPIVRVIAPLPARIVSVDQARDKDELIVVLEVGTTYRVGQLSVRLIESNGPVRRERRIATGKKRKIIVRFLRPVPGGGEVILYDHEHGIIARRQGQIFPRYIFRPRLSLLSLPDPGLEQILHDLRCTSSEEHERSVALALHVLGFSSAWWGRKAKMPKGIQRGTDAHDLIASAGADSIFLVLECSSNWVGDDKLAKLIGRTNRIRAALTPPSGYAPVVVPFVVIGQDRRNVPPATEAALARHQVGLLAADDLEDLLARAVVGVSDAELSTRLAACMPAAQSIEKITSHWQAPLPDWS